MTPSIFFLGKWILVSRATWIRAAALPERTSARFLRPAGAWQFDGGGDMQARIDVSAACKQRVQRSRKKDDAFFAATGALRRTFGLLPPNQCRHTAVLP
jgi:hypothetical protein